MAYVIHMRDINIMCIIACSVVLAACIIVIHDMNYNTHHIQNAFAQIGPDSPKVQTELGVTSENITCKEEYVLAIRTNGVSICVTSSTAKILVERSVVERIIGHTAKYEDENAKDDTAQRESQDRISDVDENQDGQTIVLNSSTITNTNATNTETTNSTSTITNTNATNTNATNTNATSTNTTTPTTSNSQKDKSNPSRVTTIPASTMSVVNFYVTDDDLNISRNAAETISTKGLLEFAINGTPITGPKTMTETGPNTGQFHVKLELPTTINGRPLNQNDIVDITYLDKSDYSGEPHTVKKSFTLSSTYAQLQTQGDGEKRIGHEFRLIIHEPDANRDSQEEDQIPLNRFEFESKGNVKATLDHRAFDANKSHMIETGPNTGIFDVMIKIPRQIDGKIINIGDWYKIIYNDYSTPSGTSEEIVLRGKIGLTS